MSDLPRKPSIPVNATPFAHPLPHFARRLTESTDAVTIVAIGSSSTAGEGGIVPYPYWLQVHLRERFAGRMIDVLNRGKGGEEAPAQLERFARDVLAARPCLVVWQVGANAVLKRLDLDVVAGAIERGVRQLSEAGIDVVLMDPQWTPPMLLAEHEAATRRMLSLIEDVAARAKVDVFQRFAMMRAWHEVERVSVDRMINPDDVERLHHSDWSARRLGWELANAIANAAEGRRT